MINVILFCFGHAVCEATRKGAFGIGGSSRWRDAQAVLWLISMELQYGSYSRGEWRLR